MIIARSMNDGNELLILGLTHANLRELQKGHPMRLTSETHGAGIPLGWTIAIVYGEDEAAIAEDLKRAGGITADTKVSAMPRQADNVSWGDKREKSE